MAAPAPTVRLASLCAASREGAPHRSAAAARIVATRVPCRLIMLPPGLWSSLLFMDLDVAALECPTLRVYVRTVGIGVLDPDVEGVVLPRFGDIVDGHEEGTARGAADRAGSRELGVRARDQKRQHRETVHVQANRVIDVLETAGRHEVRRLALHVEAEAPAPC